MTGQKKKGQIMSKRLSLLLLVLGLMFNFSFADNAEVIDSCKTVELIKPGKLKSLIKKAELPFIKKLVIKGGIILNEKDYTFISKMPALEVLDLSEVDKSGFCKIQQQKIRELVIVSIHADSESEKLAEIREEGYLGQAKQLSYLHDVVSMYKDWIGEYESDGFPNLERIKIKGLKMNLSFPFELPSTMYMCCYKKWRGGIMKDGTIFFERKDCSKDFKGHYVIKSREQIKDGGLREAVYLDYGFDSYDITSVEEIGNMLDTIPQNVRFLAKGRNYGYCILSAFEEGNNTLYFVDGYGFDIPGEEIVFNRPVYIDCSIKSKAQRIIFEKDVEYIGKETFVLSRQQNDEAPFEKFVFKKTPKEIDRKFYYFSGEPYKQVDEIDIPKGSMDFFLGLGFDSNILYEDGLKPLTLDIKLEKPNTILSVLPIDKLSSIDSLTITGFMYETDLEVLKQCKNMRYLNLAKTYITSSPQKKREEEANAAALSGLFSLLGQVADAKYTNGDMTALEHAQIAGFSKLMEDATSVTKAEEECYVPYKTLEGMKRLETVILPLRASSIGGDAFYGCTSLKHVELPPFLKSISDDVFCRCINLEKLNFPETLTYCGSSFYGTNINVIDFSKCHFDNNWRGIVELSFNPLNMKELRLPQGVETVRVSGEGKLYVPSDVKVIRYWHGEKCNEFHFESPTPPEMEHNPKNCTIYIPKGSTTAYFAKFGATNKYIEE